MKRQGFNQVLVCALLLFGLASGCNVVARTAKDVTNQPGSQQLPFAEGKVLVVSANTVIYVRLQQTISSLSGGLSDADSATSTGGVRPARSRWGCNAARVTAELTISASAN